MNARKTKGQVLVLGGDFSGLAAAACCAQLGFSVTVLEAGEHLPIPPPQALYALDPQLVRQLRLSRHGLGFAVRDLALTGLSGEARPLVLTRQSHVTARSLAAAAKEDGDVWRREQARLLQLARQARALWWDDRPLTPGLKEALAPYAAMSAAALLDRAFYSDALKAALAFDATQGGRSVLDAGSALPLLWRLAQEMSGLQAASAIPQDGMEGAMAAVAAAANAQGVELRFGTRVARIVSHAGAVNGVELTGGELIPASFVLSVRARHETLALLAPSAAGFGLLAAQERMVNPIASARLLLSLRALPKLAQDRPLTQARFILASRLESYATAHAQAMLGALAPELPMEALFIAGAEGRFTLSVCIRPVPRAPAAGWKALKYPLAEQTLLALARHFPGLAGTIAGAELLTPDDLPADGAPLDLLAPYAARMATPLKGLYLCGASAEPVPSLSGRAARLAAAAIAKETQA